MKLALIIAGVAIVAIAIGIWTSSSSSSGTGSGQNAASSSTASTVNTVNTTPRVTTYRYPEAPSAYGRSSSASVTSRRSPPPLPPRSLANPVRPKYVPSRGTPPLPPNRVSVNPRIYDYPKCPSCRRRNLRGSPQQVFWDTSRKQYRCTYGHYFTGKEV